MLTQEELIEEANRIIQEFQKYTKDFQVRGHTCTPKDTLDILRLVLRGSLVKIVDSFYHGTYGRCVRFSVVTTEGESYRVLFHQTGLSVLNDSSHFESFEQFFNSKSPNYRNDYQIINRTPSVKLKISGKAFLKSEFRISVTFCYI